MSEALLTIIIPVYKIEEIYLRKCLDSLLEQNSDAYKIILVDDGSPDNCGVICDEYANNNSIVEVIHQKNQGVSVARNSGLMHANTEWVTFVDPDDWVSKDMLKSEIDVIKGSASSADIILFCYSREYFNKSRVERIPTEDGYFDEDLLKAVKKAPFFKFIIQDKSNPYSLNAVWNKIFKRDFLLSNDIWFIPEAKKGQDRLFCAKALNLTNKIYYTNKCLYYYRCYEESVTNRYNPNIVKLTDIEINELDKIVRYLNLSEEVKELLNCRICTRLYSCMRLFYFNSKNTEKYSTSKKQVLALINRSPYEEAIRTVSYKNFNIQERVFVWLIKHRLLFLMMILVRIKDICQKRSLR